jgi:AP-1-like transcription factor
MSRKSNSDLYLSPNEQDLLVAALNSNQSGTKNQMNYTPATSLHPDSGLMGFSDDSPYLDFDPEADFDESAYGFNPNARMIGDLPDEDEDEEDDSPVNGDLHDKRKSIDGQDEDDEGGGKRREGEDKVGKKPGRKPLTSEPTSVCRFCASLFLC